MPLQDMAKLGGRRTAPSRMLDVSRRASTIRRVGMCCATPSGPRMGGQIGTDDNGPVFFDKSNGRLQRSAEIFPCLLARVALNSSDHEACPVRNRPVPGGPVQLAPALFDRSALAGQHVQCLTAGARDNLDPGWYRVEIHSTQKTGKMVPAAFAQPGKTNMVEEYRDVIAPQFSVASTLEVEVKPGDNVADFQVTSR